MSIADTTIPVPPAVESDIHSILLDNRRGTGGMILTIATEAALFLMLFFSYFYLAPTGWWWPTEVAPELRLALIMLIVLTGSSGVLMWGERLVKRGRFFAARLAMAGTILCGLVFLVLQYFEYKDHLKTLTPRTNTYGSIFYTVTSFHAAHVVVGLIMLIYVLLLPNLEPVDRAPYRPYHNVSLYWHFVDIVWIVVVALLYVLPHLLN